MIPVLQALRRPTSSHLNVPITGTGSTKTEVNNKFTKCTGVWVSSTPF